LKVIFKNLLLFDSHSILINSFGSLVVWSPTNVGKKIELLWGQIEATQLTHLKIQLHISLYIFGVSWNWGQIRSTPFSLLDHVLFFYFSHGDDWTSPTRFAWEGDRPLAPAVMWHGSEPLISFKMF
jgi:hypothetical protein